MTTYVPSYLRPLSQIRTGNQSRVDEKAEKVEVIRCQGSQPLAFEQHETVKLWVNERAYHGKTKVTSDKEITTTEEGHNTLRAFDYLLDND
ncbi:hypothetical protein DU500_12780 [Haloplanus rubicundus]|uniref:Uncharacterized protein n=1 Tax=Haloplanus rubicundus TaxID=1547898 RepID=A0A345E4V3_9EURY|nr:hypothetical protein [Haloplanus rubicundus]AXG07225.1 hypothetical protein DU500_12780 [Haloplanus rubicundus]